MRRTLAIGDIHGCIDELRDLVDRLALGVDDRLLLLGDLVDRGPDSAAVVRMAMQLQASMGPRFSVLRGNHENKHLRYRQHLRGEIPAARRTSRVRLDVERSVVHDQVGEEGWAWLDKHTVLWKRLDPGLLGVHAGILPSVRNWPEAVLDVDLLDPEEARRVSTSALYVRDVDASGRFLAIGKRSPGQRFWGAAYNGRFGHVVHGHSPTRGPVRRHAYSTGIDTGCVFGGRLTAAVWFGEIERPRHPDALVQVPARRMHAEWRETAEL